MTKRVRKKLYISMIWVVLILAIVPVFTGCLNYYQPKAYLEVTKPPLRVIYLDYHDSIAPTDANDIINNVKEVKYHSYRFNNKNDINVKYNVGLTTDHSKSVTINQNKKEK